MKWAAVLATLAIGAWLTTGLARAQAQTNVHEVESGETVKTIAEAYGLSSATILAANALPDPDLLHVGQQLVIPPVDGVLHTVQSGETLLGIARDYGVTTADLVASNALEGSPDNLPVGVRLIVPGVDLAVQAVRTAAAARSSQDEATLTDSQHPLTTRPPVGTARTYVVQDGDTLRSIAAAFNLDILSLIAVNGLNDPDLIRPGSRLTVTAPPKHVVQPGDTVGDIAWRYAVDGDALLRANGLADPDLIVTGMTLVVPTGAPAPGPPSPSPPPVASPRAPETAVAPAPNAEAAPAPGSGTAAEPAEKPAATTRRQITAMITGYAVGAGAVSSRTASGTTTHWGTVAADTRLYSFGTRIRIEGLGDTVFVVEDTGSAVRGNVFDVWFPNAASARQFGARIRQVTILATDAP